MGLFDHTPARNADGVQLLQPWQAARYRALGWNEQGNPFEYGTATGRAACRCCGAKIAKGERAVTGWHDFYGHGSHTSMRIWLHAHDCTPATTETR